MNSTNNSTNLALQTTNTLNGDLLQKVILQNDVSRLTGLEKVEYVGNICKSLGLNPLTKPIQIIKFPKSGEEKLYMTKDATEQLRKINSVSIVKVDTNVLSGGIYVVTAYATTPEGRQDSATGVKCITGLSGEILANAMMSAETKAKRRVTLSICGLGFIDECEADSIPNARKIDIVSVNENAMKLEHQSSQDIELDFVEFLQEIENAEGLDGLKVIFSTVLNHDIRTYRPDLLTRLIEAKDKKKSEFTDKENTNDFIQ